MPLRRVYISTLGASFVNAPLSSVSDPHHNPPTILKFPFLTRQFRRLLWRVHASLGGQGLLQRGRGVAAVLAASIRHLPQPIRHQRALLNTILTAASSPRQDMFWPIFFKFRTSRQAYVASSVLHLWGVLCEISCGNRRSSGHHCGRHLALGWSKRRSRVVFVRCRTAQEKILKHK